MITLRSKENQEPKGIEGTSYYHAQAVKTGELTMEKLAKRINNSTTITQADCYAVLKSMKDHIIEAPARTNGRTDGRTERAKSTLF